MSQKGSQLKKTSKNISRQSLERVLLKFFLKLFATVFLVSFREKEWTFPTKWTTRFNSFASELLSWTWSMHHLYEYLYDVRIIAIFIA